MSAAIYRDSMEFGDIQLLWGKVVVKIVEDIALQTTGNQESRAVSHTGISVVTCSAA